MENAQPPVIKKKVGLITLAIILILLGVTTILNRAAGILFFKDPYLFWAIFLILLGSELIITKVIYNSKNKKINIKFDFLSIIITCIILLFHSIFSGLSALNLDSIINTIYKLNLDSSSISDYQLISTKVIDNISFEDVEQLKIDNTLGNIVIAKSNQQTAWIEADIKSKKNFKISKQQIDNIINVDTGKTLTVKTQPPTASANKITVDYRIYIPDKLIDISTQTDMGNVYISNIKADLYIENKFGNIQIDNLEGRADIKNSNGNIDLSNITQDVNISNSFGNISCRDMQSNITIDNKNGNIDIYSNLPVKSNYDITVDFGSITMQVAALEDISLKAKTQFGNIHPIQGMQIDNKGSGAEGYYQTGTAQNKIFLYSKRGSIDISIN